MTLSRYRKGIVALLPIVAAVLAALYPAGSSPWATFAATVIGAAAVVLIPNAPKTPAPASTSTRAPSSPA
jgi:hypothetical protein